MSDINVELSDDLINIFFKEDVVEVIFEWNATWPPWPAGWGMALKYNQGVALSTWTIVHNFSSYPAGIVVTDSGGTNIVNFHITYVDINTVTLEFSGAMTGTAYLS